MEKEVEVGERGVKEIGAEIHKSQSNAIFQPYHTCP
jgi:hypothetical protein